MYVSAKSFLDGDYDTGTGLMRDDLRVAGYIPTAQPYNVAPFNYTGTETRAASVTTVTGSNAIVDWVLLELRNSSTPTTIVSRRAALIQQDGDIVDTDGTSAVRFTSIASGSYYVAVRHRNHLGVMTSTTRALSQTTTAVNFTLAATATYGTNARKTVGSVMTMFGGNANSISPISYSGSSNDRTAVLNVLGASTFLTPLAGYNTADVTMNGTVTYSGSSNDRTTVLNTLGASTFLTPKAEQLP